MDVLKTWLGRIIFAAAGVILIVTSAGQPTNQVGGIVTGVACILFAIYATIRGLAGDVAGKGKQVIGLINLSAWYDFVVLGVLVLASVIAYVA